MYNKVEMYNRATDSKKLEIKSEVMLEKVDLTEVTVSRYEQK